MAATRAHNKSFSRYMSKSDPNDGLILDFTIDHKKLIDNAIAQLKHASAVAQLKPGAKAPAAPNITDPIKESVRHLSTRAASPSCTHTPPANIFPPSPPGSAAAAVGAHGPSAARPHGALVDHLACCPGPARLAPGRLPAERYTRQSVSSGGGCRLVGRVGWSSAAAQARGRCTLATGRNTAPRWASQGGSCAIWRRLGAEFGRACAHGGGVGRGPYTSAAAVCLPDAARVLLHARDLSRWYQASTAGRLLHVGQTRGTLRAVLDGLQRLGCPSVIPCGSADQDRQASEGEDISQSLHVVLFMYVCLLSGGGRMARGMRGICGHSQPHGSTAPHALPLSLHVFEGQSAVCNGRS